MKTSLNCKLQLGLDGRPLRVREVSAKPRGEPGRQRRRDEGERGEARGGLQDCEPPLLLEHQGGNSMDSDGFRATHQAAFRVVFCPIEL